MQFYRYAVIITDLIFIIITRLTVPDYTTIIAKLLHVV